MAAEHQGGCLGTGRTLEFAGPAGSDRNADERMPLIDIPFLGNIVLCAILLSTAYTFAVSLAAARGRPDMLRSARFGAYATCALVLLAVCVLAYAFQSHDFRIRYVARYSDRSMSWWYLVTSLWGGQDGSLLWWAALLCGYTAGVTAWMKGRYLELQPYVLATLMSILAFFGLLMLFAANPFSTYVAAAPPDGEGLNPLLQNYWMTIHPPTLYLGFVGWSVPFAFVVAALATGRLHDEWVHAVRRWSLIAWLFLSIGLTLGMIWSYEELGWGGYWAWDPVENASFMPWLVGTAYIHSAMIQERYGMLKVWNVFLLCLTFIMTIFGTFLTRSGMISSVHSFARSDIGIWFAWYLVFLVVGCILLIAFRLPRLKAQHRIQALLSREFAFLLNNWILLALMVFVLGLTTFPLVTEWIEGQQATVGPSVYNHLLIPFGLILLCLMGAGPMISWRRATGKNLVRAFMFPTAAGLVVGLLHGIGGWFVGFPPYVTVEPIFDTAVGTGLAKFTGIAPVIATTLSAFVIASVVQEFQRGAAVRMRKGETLGAALWTLVGKARRRYGGYIVHVGITLMYIGFTGAAYDVEVEEALSEGEVMEVGDYRVRFDGARMETDRNKRMIFADMSILDEDGRVIDTASPAKFIYHTHREMPTTEVAIRTRPRDDLYLIMSTVDAETHRGTFRVIVRPLVIWIWIGFALLILGAAIALTPTAREVLGRSRTAARAAAAAVLLLAVGLGATGPPTARAQDDSSSTLHAGTVVIDDPDERRLFQRLLCQCGDCARLPMDSCGCGWAENHRAQLRQQLARGDRVEEIVAAWREQYGVGSIGIPPDEGLGRAMWAIPVTLAVLAIGGIVMLGRRWRDRGQRDGLGRSDALSPEPGSEGAEGYDERLEDELRRLEGD